MDMGNKWCPGLLYAALHLHSLLGCAWPCAFMFVWFYAICLPFAACIPPLQKVTEVLLKIVQWPMKLAEKIVNLDPCCCCE